MVNTLLWNLRDDFEIHLALYNNEIDFQLPPDIKFLDLKEDSNQGFIRSFFRMPLISHKLHRYCKENQIDISVGFLNRPCYTNALMRSLWRYKGRIVLSERTHQSTMLKGRGGLYRMISTFMVKYAYRRADLIIANAHAIKTDLQIKFSIKTAITVIQNPVDIEQIQRLKTEPTDFKKEPGVFYYVAVGGYRQEKNYSFLLDALSLLKDHPIKLILVGGGELQKEIDDKIKALNLGGHVFQTGIASNPYQYMQLADAMVISSYVEGFPNVLLEGLACGKPVVSTDCKSGPREILNPESDFNFQLTSGFECAPYGILTGLQDPKDLAAGMEKMFVDSTLREAYIQNAELRAADFNISETCKKYMQAFLNTSIRQAE